MSAAANLQRRARNLRELPRSGTIAAARAIKDQARLEAARDTGDGRLSGMGRKGVKLRTVDTVRGSGSKVTGKVVGLPVGAWSIVSDGADRHQIRRRRGGVKRRRRGVLKIGTGFVTGPVSHPGSPAKHTWRRVRRWAADEIPRMWARQVHQAVR